MLLFLYNKYIHGARFPLLNPRSTVPRVSISEQPKEENRFQKWRLENPEKQRAAEVKYWEKNRDKILDRAKISRRVAPYKQYFSQRKSQLKRKFGLTPEQYEEIGTNQGNVCAICKKPEHRKNKRGETCALSVDHNHSTGKVRELLCRGCNSALGHSQESIEVLEALIAYIRKHEGTN